jgi:hypothetical protein
VRLEWFAGRDPGMSALQTAAGGRQR